jgi:2-dehydropantoate 2-reductase
MLARTRREVHFVARSDIQAIRRNGLRIRSPWGDTHLRQVSIHNDLSAIGAVDVVLVCFKTTSNDQLPRLLGPLTRPGSLVVLMQNGLGAETEVAKMVPHAHVAGAMCFLCSNRVGPGHIEHIDYGKVTFGAFDAGAAEMLSAVEADFTAAGVPVERVADLETGRWKKLVWNIPYNGLSVVLRATTDRIMADASSRSLVSDLMDEVVSAARACGCNLPDAFAVSLREMTVAMQPYKTSMMLDHEHGRPLEVRYIYRRPIEMAAAAGAKMPRTEALADELEFIDRSNRKRA